MWHKKMNIKELMMSLEVDPKTGCMYRPKMKSKRDNWVCNKVWEFVNGIKRPSGHYSHLRHLCNNGHLGCCNITHLKMGTAKENSQDMVACGHSILHNQYGENNLNAKLTASQVIEIRSLYSSNQYTQKQLGQMFGVTRSLVGGITRGTNWKAQDGK